MFLAHVHESDARRWLAGELSDGALWACPPVLPGEKAALWVVRVDGRREFLAVFTEARARKVPVIWNAGHAVTARFGREYADAVNGTRCLLEARTIRERLTTKKAPWWRRWAKGLASLAK